jgi:hypothetical protein
MRGEYRYLYFPGEPKMEYLSTGSVSEIFDYVRSFPREEREFLPGENMGAEELVYVVRSLKVKKTGETIFWPGNRALHVEVRKGLNLYEEEVELTSFVYKIGKNNGRFEKEITKWVGK